MPVYMEERTLASLRAWDGQKSVVHTDSLDGNETFEVSPEGLDYRDSLMKT